jgi:hypothetical protein
MEQETKQQSRTRTRRRELANYIGFGFVGFATGVGIYVGISAGFNKMPQGVAIGVAITAIGVGLYLILRGPEK